MTTETVMHSLPPELVARMDEISDDHEAGHVQPGWWMRTIRDDDTREWVYIVLVMDGKHIPTGRKVMQFGGISPDEPDCLNEMRTYASQPVCCLTKPQARKLGLTDPRKKDTARTEDDR